MWNEFPHPIITRTYTLKWVDSATASIPEDGIPFYFTHTHYTHRLVIHSESELLPRSGGLLQIDRGVRAVSEVSHSCPLRSLGVVGPRGSLRPGPPVSRQSFQRQLFVGNSLFKRKKKIRLFFNIFILGVGCARSKFIPPVRFSLPLQSWYFRRTTWQQITRRTETRFFTSTLTERSNCRFFFLNLELSLYSVVMTASNN